MDNKQRESYTEIIEMEVLNGIDKSLHALILDYYERRSKGINLFCSSTVENLKKKIVEYIDKQYKTIILENLDDSVHMIPPVSE